MAGFDNTALQTLALIMETQSRKQERAAERGYNETMQRFQNEQRKYEINAQLAEQEARDSKERMYNLSQRISDMGLDMNQFGMDSQVDELVNDFSQSLQGRAESASAMARAYDERISQLQNAQSAYIRGQQYGQSLMPQFEMDSDGTWQLIDSPDGTTGYTEFLQAVQAGDNDALAEMLGANIEGLGSIERSAYINAVRQQMLDRSDEIDARRMAIEEHSAMLDNKLKNAQLRAYSAEEQSKLRNELTQLSDIDYSRLLTGSFSNIISGLNSETASVRENAQEQLDLYNRRIAAAVRPIQTGLDLILGVSDNGESSDVTKNILDSYAQFAQSLPVVMSTNPTQGFANIERAAILAYRAMDNGNISFEQALKEGKIPSDAAGILVAYLSNPEMNPGFNVAAQSLNELVRGALVKEAIDKTPNPDLALEKASSIRSSDIGFQIGNDLARIMQNGHKAANDNRDQINLQNIANDISWKNIANPTSALSGFTAIGDISRLSRLSTALENNGTTAAQRARSVREEIQRNRQFSSRIINLAERLNVEPEVAQRAEEIADAEGDTSRYSTQFRFKKLQEIIAQLKSGEIQ